MTNKTMLNLLEKILNFFKKNTGTGYVVDKQDPRDLFFGELASYESYGAWEDLLASFPKNFRLEYDKSWLYNQRSTTSCVFHATTSLLNYVFGAKLSPRYLSKFGFAISNLGWGAYMRDGLKAADKNGIVEYDDAPNTPENTASDRVYKNLSISTSMSWEALKRSKWLFVRVDGGRGEINDFDAIREYIYREQCPCVVGIQWYTDWNGIADEAKIEYPTGKNFVGHAMCCIGWEGDYMILVDSYNRIVKLHKRNWTMDIWGILKQESIDRYHVELRSAREDRNSKKEKEVAFAIKNEVNARFAVNDASRGILAKFWFPIIDAITYNNYTNTDIINWISNYKRTGKELFDLTKKRILTLG